MARRGARVCRGSAPAAPTWAPSAADDEHNNNNNDNSHNYTVIQYDII